MDIVRIQSLLAGGRVADLGNLDGGDVYFQVGIYQKGNRRRASGNLNSYAPAVFSLDQLLGVIPIPVVKGFKYAVGEFAPEVGGVIAHRWWSSVADGVPDEDGLVQNYLVLSLKDLASNVYSDITAQVPSPGATSVWNGRANTTNIVLQGPTTGAALACENLVDDGYSDWYLPAVSEFMVMWSNYMDISRGLEAATGMLLDLTKTYWTSTEVKSSSTRAYLFNLSSNGLLFSAKNSTTANVRPMRRFSI